MGESDEDLVDGSGDSTNGIRSVQLGVEDVDADADADVSNVLILPTAAAARFCSTMASAS